MTIIEPPPVAPPPWWIRIGIKLVLTRLPIAAAVWRRLGIFRHGAMDDPSYAVGVFESHRKRAGLTDLKGCTVLELGPGDSIASAVIARAHGARALLVDAGPFASQDIDGYRALSGRLHATGLDAPNLECAQTLEDVLDICQAVYLTDGLRSLQEVPDRSVDLILSQAVLEHVRVSEFDATMREMARVLTRDGIASHRVDLRDHLGGGLNNLRIPSSLWERASVVRSGFYTNRMSMAEMVDCFERSYLTVQTTIRSQWLRPPIRRRSIAREFRGRTDADLRVAGFDVVLRGDARVSGRAARAPR